MVLADSRKFEMITVQSGRFQMHPEFDVSLVTCEFLHQRALKNLVWGFMLGSYLLSISGKSWIGPGWVQCLGFGLNIRPLLVGRGWGCGGMGPGVSRMYHTYRVEVRVGFVATCPPTTQQQKQNE